MKNIRKYQRFISVQFIILFLSTFTTNLSFGITGHSSMPEYRSFEPVSTTNMVNLFSGGFTYNIPLLDVPNGYPINLSYHSGDVNNEAQASWVGLGWTLNPGAVNRIKRGFADEFNGEEVKYYNRMPKNWTISANLRVSGEIKGSEFKGSLGKTIAYNNYQGFAESFFGSVTDPLGIASVNLSYSEGKFGFDASYNLANALRALGEAANKSDKNATTTDPNQGEIEELMETKSMKLSDIKKDKNALKLSNKNQFNWSVSLPKSQPTPLNVSEYSGKGFNIKFDGGPNTIPFPVEVGEVGAGGTYTYKKNKEYKSLPVYGYMNSEAALENDEAMMDYYTENEVIYDKYEKNIGIPFPNNDMFSLTGESMGGTFRAFRADFGHYRKNRIESSMKTVSASADISFGTNLSSVGGEVGGTFQQTVVQGWENEAFTNNKFLTKEDFSTSTNERFVLRFTGDKAGSYDQVKTEKPLRLYDTNFNTEAEGFLKDKRVSRSTYVSMKKNEDFNVKTTASRYAVPYKVNQQYLSIKVGESITDYIRQEDNAMGEVTTYNKNGTRFTYGLPLYTKDERQLTYHIENVRSSDFLPNSEGMVIKNDDENLDAKSDMKVGFHSPEKYASQFLLTQITSPDYIDRTFDGLTSDDFGSFTRFNYQRFAGGDGNWYKYRSPFSGLNYSVGGLSTNRDNTGSFSSGEKELYYIESVVSKTHIARFYTSERRDGYESNGNLVKGGGDNTGKSLRKLDKIELYALADCEEKIAGKGYYEPKENVQPIKTVKFEYSYELCKDLPNNSNISEFNHRGDNINQGGKLTLKRVWFEYEGKKTSKISPYQFKYNYPEFKNQSNIENEPLKRPIAPYRSANDPVEIDKYSPSASKYNENPNYVPANTDRWGNYRDYQGLMDQLGDLARFFPFVNQKPYPIITETTEPNTLFDPAAHCLKQIKLPSGGSILVQYEQGDYSYVQDHKAMAMVPLKELIEAPLQPSKNKHVIDLDKVGLSLNSYTTDEDKMEFLAQLFEPMIQNKRMYFNFLYRLEGDGLPNYNSTNSEYIEGFSFIKGYGLTLQGDAYFTFGELPESPVHKKIETNGASQELPREVCREFYSSSRKGIVSDGDGNGLSSDEDHDSKADLLKFLVNRGASRGDQCKSFDPKMSFVRLQLPEKVAKKGGGVRVKRLMMYDEGIGSNGLATLYGNEYEYKQKVKSAYSNEFIDISSGVATTEPSAGRRESPLVYPILRDKEKGKLGILAGKNLYKNEGPLGESFYPSASVGYSKVTVRNIHKGQTSSGYTVHEFHTCKDFPVEMIPTTLKPKNGKNFSTGGLSFGSVGGSYGVKELEMAQGYTFINNNMHGQPKRVQQFAIDTEVPLGETIYEYFDYKEKVPVMGDHMVDEGSMFLGGDSEVLAESREVIDETYAGHFGADKSWGYIPAAIPIPVYYNTKVRLGGSFNQNIVKTHVINKLITYPCILKKVINISPDRVKHTTENLAFDKYTGDPVKTRTYDDFDQPFINQQILASWEYPAMKSKGINENVTASGKFLIEGSDYYLDFNYPDMTDCEVMGKFNEGDFIEVKQQNATALFHVGKLEPEELRVQLLKSGLQETVAIPTGSEIAIEVIKSGYKNNMAASIGGFTYKQQRDANGIPKDVTPIDVDDEITDEGNDFITALNSSIDKHFRSSGGVTSDNSFIVKDEENNNTFNGLELNIGKGANSSCNTTVEDVIIDLKTFNNGGGFNLDVKSYKENNQVAECLSDLLVSTSSINHVVSPCNNIPENIGDFIWQHPPTKENANCDSDVSLIRYYYDFYNKYTNLPSELHYCRYSDNWQYSSSTPWFPNRLITIKYDESIGVDLRKFGGITNRDNDWEMRIERYDYNGQYIGEEFHDKRKNNRLCGVAFERPNGLNSGYYTVRGELQIDKCGWGRSEHVVKGVICVDKYHPNFSTEVTYPNKYIDEELIITAVTKNNQYSPKYNDFSVGWTLKKQNEFGTYISIDNANNSNLDQSHEIQQTFSINSGGNYQLVLNIHENNSNSDRIVTNTFKVETATDECVCDNNIYVANLTNTLEYNPSNGDDFTDKIGKFHYSRTTGKVFFKAVDCPIYRPINCIKVCNPTPAERTSEPLEEVVTASASTLSDTWMQNFVPYSIKGNVVSDNQFNDYETGNKGNWRTQSSYVYRDQIDVDAGKTRNFEKGLFKMELFDWRNPSNNTSKWVLTSTVNSYDANGQPLEDENILGIKSTAVYGFNNTLPIMVAQNAQSRSVFFESFESKTADDVTPSVSHTGQKSYLLKPSHTVDFSFYPGVDEYSSGDDYMVRFWVKSGIRAAILEKELVLKTNTYRSSGMAIKKIASSGEWNLFEVNFHNGYLGRYGSIYRLSLELSNKVLEGVYIDDFRVQPVDAEAVCYVYDHAQRLTAVLDDQHFASIYQYNAEGVLVRKLKETTEGVKTISETQYNTKGISRSAF